MHGGVCCCACSVCDGLSLLLNVFQCESLYAFGELQYQNLHEGQNFPLTMVSACNLIKMLIK